MWFDFLIVCTNKVLWFYLILTAMWFASRNHEIMKSPFKKLLRMFYPTNAYIIRYCNQFYVWPDHLRIATLI